MRKGKNIKQIKTSNIKLEHYKISKLFNDSTVSKSVRKKYIEVNDLSGSQYTANKI